MATQFYPSCRQALGSSGANLSPATAINFTSDTFKVVAVTGTYTVNFASDVYLSAIAAGARAATATLASVTLTNGVLNAAGVTFTAVPAGAAIIAVVMYKQGGADASSPLISYMDNMIGLPITPNGGDITITWDATNKIVTI